MIAAGTRYMVPGYLVPGYFVDWYLYLVTRYLYDSTFDGGRELIWLVFNLVGLSNHRIYSYMYMSAAVVSSAYSITGTLPGVPGTWYLVPGTYTPD